MHAREAELPGIAAFLGIGVDELIDRYTRLSDDRSELVFIEHEDGSCIFLDEGNNCTINPVKPLQCKTFPYDWTVPEDTLRQCQGQWVDE